MGQFGGGGSGGVSGLAGGKGKQRNKSGNNFGVLGQGGEQMVARNWMLTGEVVTSGQILGLF